MPFPYAALEVPPRVTSEAENPVTDSENVIVTRMFSIFE